MGVEDALVYTYDEVATPAPDPVMAKALAALKAARTKVVSLSSAPMMRDPHTTEEAIREFGCPEYEAGLHIFAEGPHDPCSICDTLWPPL